MFRIQRNISPISLLFRRYDHVLFSEMARCGGRIGALASIFLLRVGGQAFAPAGAAEVTDIHSNGNGVPIWTGGVLVSIVNNNTGTPIIHAFGETGHETIAVAFSIRGVDAIRIAGVLKREQWNVRAGRLDRRT
jgi:hypothetical protein